jgi:hypothetical protein
MKRITINLLIILIGAVIGIPTGKYLAELKWEAIEYMDRTGKPASWWDAAWNDLSKKGKRK